MAFRKQFLKHLVEENEIDTRLEGIVDDFLIDGKGLFYFRPIRDTYRIMWFSADNYRAYYDAMGELEEIELIYSFTVRDTINAPAATSIFRVVLIVTSSSGSGVMRSRRPSPLRSRLLMPAHRAWLSRSTRPEH